MRKKEKEKKKKNARGKEHDGYIRANLMWEAQESGNTNFVCFLRPNFTDTTLGRWHYSHSF